MGILTDGKRWLLRWPNAGPVKATALPYAFTLEDSQTAGSSLFEWLRDHALSRRKRTQQPSPLRHRRATSVSTAPTYERDIAALKVPLRTARGLRTPSEVKRQLWENLLTAALGEIARSSASQLDDLFVRHTYLSAVIGMVVQASFGDRHLQALGGE